MMGPGIQYKDFKILKDLGIMSQVRGIDGAGIYQVRSVNHNKTWSNFEHLYKTGENFSSMMSDIDDNKTRNNDFKDLFSSTMADVVMCHVRWATKGSIIQSNSHPFNTFNVVGAHNGTLTDKRFEDPKKTDSEKMFEEINRGSLEATLDNLDKDSAYAITMYDRRDHHMYFANNGKRDLAIAFLEDRGVMYWASEIGMLRYILERAKEKFKIYYIPPFEIMKVYAPDITTASIRREPMEIITRVAYTKEHISRRPKVETVKAPANESETERWAREEKLNFTKRSGGTTNKRLDGSDWSQEYLSSEVPGTGKDALKSTKDGTNIVPFNKQAAATGTGRIASGLSNDKGRVSVPEVPKKEVKTFKSFFSKCVCEKKTFNLLEGNHCQRGLLKGYKYIDGKFYCADCVPASTETKEPAVG